MAPKLRPAGELAGCSCDHLQPSQFHVSARGGLPSPRTPLNITTVRVSPSYDMAAPKRGGGRPPGSHVADSGACTDEERDAEGVDAAGEPQLATVRPIRRSGQSGLLMFMSLLFSGKELTLRLIRSGAGGRSMVGKRRSPKWTLRVDC